MNYADDFVHNLHSKVPLALRVLKAPIRRFFTTFSIDCSSPNGLHRLTHLGNSTSSLSRIDMFMRSIQLGYLAMSHGDRTLGSGAAFWFHR